jgi:hypothetical protein
VPHGKCRDDPEKPGDAAAKQQQADDEQDVVGADGDVMDPGRSECLEHRPRALASAGVILGRLTARVEDVLTHEDISVVDVHERLMIWVVREECGMQRQPAGRTRQRYPPRDFDGKAVRQRTHGADLPRDVAAIHGHRHAGLNERRHARTVAFEGGAVEECIRRPETELMGEIEVVKHQRARQAGG